MAKAAKKPSPTRFQLDRCGKEPDAFKDQSIGDNDGEIHYRDFSSNPKVDIFTKKVHLLAENLSNAKHNKELMPSTAEASAQVCGGEAKLHMKMNLLNSVHINSVDVKIDKKDKNQRPSLVRSSIWAKRTS